MIKFTFVAGSGLVAGVLKLTVWGGTAFASDPVATNEWLTGDSPSPVSTSFVMPSTSATIRIWLQSPAVSNNIGLGGNYEALGFGSVLIYNWILPGLPAVAIRGAMSVDDISITGYPSVQQALTNIIDSVSTVSNQADDATTAAANAILIANTADLTALTAANSTIDFSAAQDWETDQQARDFGLVSLNGMYRTGTILKIRKSLPIPRTGGCGAVAAESTPQ
jgi:hypothetical protein